MNVKNYKKVLAKIKAHPDCWEQSSWHWGSQHCFFGHAQIEAGKRVSTDTVRRDARLFLQLNLADADYLSSPRRTMTDFKEFLSYDRDGYNRAGYDRAGYNRAGYNRAGYDRAGYNRDGVDRDGLFWENGVLVER